MMNNKFPFAFSIGLHLLILAALIWAAYTTTEVRYTTAPANVNIIQAHTVSQQQLQKELNHIEAQKIAAQQKALAAAEAAKAKALKAQIAAEQAKRAALLKEKMLIAQKAKLQAAQQAAKKERSTPQKTAVNPNLMQAQEQQKALEQKLWQQQMAADQQMIQGAQTQQQQGEIDKYKALILQAIAQRWIVPDNADKTLTTKLLIRLAPGGMVLNVSVITSSGNDVLDRSAVTAVYRASPLPVPADIETFKAFKQIELTVRPENVK